MNLTALQDNLWSAQEAEQLLGRVHRHGQKKTSIRYDLIATNTSDVFIEAVSHEKGLMHSKLMNMPTALRELYIYFVYYDAYTHSHRPHLRGGGRILRLILSARNLL